MGNTEFEESKWSLELCEFTQQPSECEARMRRLEEKKLKQFDLYQNNSPIRTERGIPSASEHIPQGSTLACPSMNHKVVEAGYQDSRGR